MNRLGLLFGTAFGFLIAGARLNDYDVIHNALLLRDPYVFLLMGSALAVALPLLWLLERRGWQTPLGGPMELSRSRVQQNHLFGAATFGVGWALTGTCPGPAIAAVAGGNLLGLVTMGGLFVGIVLRQEVIARQQAALPDPVQIEPAPAVN